MNEAFCGKPIEQYPSSAPKDKDIVENMHRAIIGVKHNQGRHAQAKAAFNVVEPELERLREEKERLSQSFLDFAGKCGEDYRALKAENERLREALEEMINLAEAANVMDDPAYDAARKALGDEQ